MAEPLAKQDHDFGTTCGRTLDSTTRVTAADSQPDRQTVA